MQHTNRCGADNDTSRRAEARLVVVAGPPERLQLIWAEHIQVARSDQVSRACKCLLAVFRRLFLLGRPRIGGRITRGIGAVLHLEEDTSLPVAHGRSLNPVERSEYPFSMKPLDIEVLVEGSCELVTGIVGVRQLRELCSGLLSPCSCICWLEERADDAAP